MTVIKNGESEELNRFVSVFCKHTDFCNSIVWEATEFNKSSSSSKIRRKFESHQ